MIRSDRGPRGPGNAQPDPFVDVTTPSLSWVHPASGATAGPTHLRAVPLRLGVNSGQTLFVDGREDDVLAAARVGLTTLHFVGDQALGQLPR